LTKVQKPYFFGLLLSLLADFVLPKQRFKRVLRGFLAILVALQEYLVGIGQVWRPAEVVDGNPKKEGYVLIREWRIPRVQARILAWQ
jgi:hypothetical protein